MFMPIPSCLSPLAQNWLYPDDAKQPLAPPAAELPVKDILPVIFGKPGVFTAVVSPPF